MRKSVWLVLLVALTFSFSSNAQKEGDYWYFGNNAGVKFDGDKDPVNLTNGKMSNSEGVASISNVKGELLFYTDGQDVYNKAHQIMKRFPTVPATLNGHNSSTQSGVIVPQPVRDTRYYIFTVDEEGGPLEYVIMDTSGDFGNGMIIQAPKRLINEATEKITAVKHANKVDTWVIAHEWGNNKFYAYLLTGAGLSSSPVISTIGPTHEKDHNGFTKGYLKSSPDGTKLAAAVVGWGSTSFSNRKKGRIEIYDFDNATGKISNNITLRASDHPSGGSYDNSYGVEFSPNGRFLYVSSWGFYGDRNNDLNQIDLNAGSANAIKASVYKVADLSGSAGGALQIAPNGKIYIARYRARYLSVIEKPNCPKSLCSYKSNAISLTGRSMLGLPTFIQSYFSKKEFEYGDSTGATSGICYGDSTQFWILDKTDLDSAVWNFGDTASKAANVSRKFDPSHVFTGPGTFEVQLILYRKGGISKCELDTIKRLVTISPVPTVDLGNDTMICAGNSVSYNVLTGKATYDWQDGSTQPVINVNKTTEVTIKLTLAGCSAYDTVQVDVIDYPAINMVDDTTLCPSDSLIIQLASADSFRWSDNSTDSFLIIRNPGKYHVDAYNFTCKSSDTINVKYNPFPSNYSLGNDTLLCAGDSLLLVGPPGYKGYLWSHPSLDSTLTVTLEDEYWLRITDTVCAYYDTIYVSFQNPTPVDLGTTKVICDGDSVEINATMSNATYKWHDNTTDSIFVAKTAGYKRVTITNLACELTDSVLVQVNTPPTLELGNDTVLCTGDTLVPIKNAINGYKYFWNGQEENADLEITQAGKYVLIMKEFPDEVCVVSDSFVVDFQDAIVITLPNDTVLCAGDEIDIYAYTDRNPTTVEWQDGQSNLNRTNNKNDVWHVLKVGDQICISKDSFKVEYNPEIILELGNDTTLCDLETIQFDVTQSGFSPSYFWEDLSGMQLSTSPVYSVADPGETVVSRINDGLCEKMDTITVDFKYAPVFSLGNDTILCDNNTYNLDMSHLGAEEYTWQDASKGSSFLISGEGTYNLLAQNGRCASQDDIGVLYTTTPTISIGFTDTLLCDVPNFSFDFTLPHTNVNWSDGYTDPTRTITDGGTFTVTSTNQCGTASASFTINVDPFGCIVLFPTAFSPNGDNLNEKFQAQGNILEFLDMQIYNKWGEKVYDGPAIEGWDGTYNGADCQMGYYTWVIRYKKLVNGYARTHTQDGVVYLVR